MRDPPSRCPLSPCISHVSFFAISCLRSHHFAATGKPKCSTPQPEEQISSSKQCNKTTQSQHVSNVAACFKCLSLSHQSRFSKLPVFLYRFDCPIKFLPQSLGEELLDRHFKFLAKNHGKTWIDVILPRPVSMAQRLETLQGLTILEVPSATSLLLSLSFRCMSMLLIR